jgi:membrane fusion protein (multidrug efflux system)
MALPKPARITIAVVLLTTVVASAYYLNRSESSAAIQSTDDAYVQADFTSISPQVSGTVDRVLVKDNQAVKSGDLLFTLDDRDFIIAVDAAKAQVSSAQASISSLQAQLEQQNITIHQTQTVVSADQATLKLAQENRTRYRNLAADGAGSLQALQQAEAQFSIQQASLEKSRAGQQAAHQQVVIVQADLAKARAAFAQAQAAQHAAELKLSYTRVTAPIAGSIGQKAARIGAFVSAGKPLLEVVPLDAAYITANFRETQLTHVHAGQAVEVQIDALPGEALRAKVDSLSPASALSYSAVASPNATGNFTKIVQRLPVRISIDPNQAAAAKLRAGMSVTAKIHTQA